MRLEHSLDHGLRDPHDNPSSDTSASSEAVSVAALANTSARLLEALRAAETLRQQLENEMTDASVEVKQSVPEWDAAANAVGMATLSIEAAFSAIEDAAQLLRDGSAGGVHVN